MHTNLMFNKLHVKVYSQTVFHNSNFWNFEISDYYFNWNFIIKTANTIDI